MICFRKQIFLLNRRCNGHNRSLLLQLQKLKEQREAHDAFTASVMLMLIMMEIRSPPFSCEANSLLLRRKGRLSPFFTSHVNGRRLAESMFIHTNGINLQTQSILPRRNFPISFPTTADEIHDGERATLITGGDSRAEAKAVSICPSLLLVVGAPLGLF